MRHRPPIIYYCNDWWLSHLSQGQVGQWGVWNRSQHATTPPWWQRWVAAWLAFTGQGDVIINPYQGTNPQWRGVEVPWYCRPYLAILRMGAWLRKD